MTAVSLDRNPPRTCCDCRRSWAVPADAGIGWSPTAHGWSCPACSRGRAARVDAAARRLLRHRDRWWLHVDEHDARHARCLWCEAVRRATTIELSA